MILSKRNTVRILFLSTLALALAGIAAYLFFPCQSSCTRTVKKVTPKVVVKAPPEPVEVTQTLTSPRGTEVPLDEIASRRNVAIVVMKGPWCKVCRDQLLRLSARAHEVWGAGGYVIGLTDSSPEENAALAEELGIPFPIYADEDHDVLKDWNLYREGTCHPTPGVVFLGERGQVERVHKGRYPGKPQEEWIISELRSLQ